MSQLLTLASSQDQGVIQQRLDLVANTLAHMENQHILAFFREHASLLVHCLHKHYPLTPDMLEQGQVKWDWRRLSSSRVLTWSEPLIDEHSSTLDWTALSQNQALPWSATLIERHTQHWNWGHLSDNPSLPWSIDLLQANTYQWHWVTLSRCCFFS